MFMAHMYPKGSKRTLRISFNMHYWKPAASPLSTACKSGSGQARSINIYLCADVGIERACIED
jgi:hypothetical protein